MKKLLLIALSTSLAMGANAADEHKFYAGGGLSAWKVTDRSNGSGSLNLTALEGSIGYEVLPWLAVEGRVGTGVERDRDTFSTAPYDQTPSEDDPGLIQFKQDITDVKGELEYYASLYLKPQIKNDTAIIYALAGVTTHSTSFEGSMQTWTGTYNSKYEVTDFQKDGAPSTLSGDSKSDTSFSMGLGIGFYFNDHYVFNIEYKNFIQSAPLGNTDGTLKASGVTLGVNYSF